MDCVHSASYGACMDCVYFQYIIVDKSSNALSVAADVFVLNVASRKVFMLRLTIQEDARAACSSIAVTREIKLHF